MPKPLRTYKTKKGTKMVWLARNRWAGWITVTIVMLVVVGVSADDGDSKPPAPSSYADAEKLIAYFQQTVRRMGADLSDPDEYGDEQQERVSMRAHTLAAVALVLRCHDQKHPWKGLAGELLEVASELASASDDFEEARTLHAKLADLAKSKGKEKSEVDESWEPVADLAELMKAVPIINNQMRRGIQSRRFARSADRTAMYAAALAAVAQASSLDDSYCGDEEDFAKWKRLCAEMRDGAAAAAKAVAEKNQDEAKRQAERIVKTCDACHDSFR